jgi:hypothetical protein
MRRVILLSDDRYLGKIALREGVEHVYDLLTFLEACIVKGMIQKMIKRSCSPTLNKELSEELTMQPHKKFAFDKTFLKSFRRYLGAGDLGLYRMISTI